MRLFLYCKHCDKEIKVELLQNNVDLKFDLNGNFIKID